MTAVAPARRATWHDAYDTQMQLWRWTRPGEPGERWLRTAFQHARQGLSDDVADMQMKLCAAENRKLLDAEPIFVSAEMCDVVDAARHSFDPEPLYPTDLLCAHGFLVFEQPIVMPATRGDPLVVSAVSWAPMFAGDNWDEVITSHGGDPLAYFKGKDYTQVWAGIDEDGKPNSSVDGVAIAIYSPTEPGTWAHSNGASMVPVHFTPWWFGMTFEGNETDLEGDHTGAEWWWRLLQTTLRLMQQQLSHRTRYQPDRGNRRDGKKRGFVEREITVVRLRREHIENPDAPQGEANYSHRFIVSGHWRNQWYPASTCNRQIWISAYVKGPEDAPLLIKPRRVYTWTR